MARQRPAGSPAVPRALLGKLGGTLQDFRHREEIFSQGDPADAVFCVQKGRIKISVVSENGREAVLAIVEAGEFFGEGALVAGHPTRLLSASSVGRSTVHRFRKEAVARLLHEDREFADVFVPYLVARAARLEEDLIDRIFNSTEKRLARVLLILAHFGKDLQPQRVVPPISQETLAQMVGASRARVSSFLNKFRKLGFIDYNGDIRINNSLLGVVLSE